MNTNENALRGTPAQLAGRLAVNGKPLGQAEISFLTRMGFAVSDGTAKTRSGRGGKPATIWIFNPENAFTIEAIEKARGRRKSAKPVAAPVAAPVAHEGTNAVTKEDMGEFRTGNRAWRGRSVAECRRQAGSCTHQRQEKGRVMPRDSLG